MSALWTISMVLLSVWLVGIITASTAHGFLHLLLFLAAAILLIRFVPRRRTVD